MLRLTDFKKIYRVFVAVVHLIAVKLYVRKDTDRVVAVFKTHHQNGRRAIRGDVTDHLKTGII